MALRTERGWLSRASRAMVRRTRRGFASLAPVGLVSVLAMASTGCFPDAGPGPKPVSNRTIHGARAFDEFPLYWLGESYEGLPLATVRLTTDGDGVTHASFSYGEPKTAEGSFGQHWLPQLEVNIQPYCGYSPNEHLSGPTYDWEAESIGIEVRSVDGYVQRYSNAEYLHLWTGGAFVHVRTWKSDVDVEDAARVLIPIAESTGSALQPLPPPIATSC